MNNKMNFIFGVISPKQSYVKSSKKNLKNYLKDQDFTQNMKPLVDSKSVYITHTDAKNKVLGAASEGDYVMILYGYVYEPLPDWKKKSSPLDNPDVAAAHLLSRYLKKGNDFLQDVYGHYSLVIYNKKSKAVVIGRDSGMNEIYYHESKNGFIFSTKPRLAAEAIGNKLQINRQREDFFLIQGFYPYEETPYKDVLLMKPSTVMKVKGINITTTATKHSQAPGLGGLEGELSLINGLHAKLRQAMNDMLPSKKQKVAVLLGGFDSALVASLLKNEGCEVETFSFHYSDEAYNQAHTDTVAEYLGITHNWIKIDEKVIEEGLDKFSHLFNQPTNWPSYVIQTAYLCEEIAKRGFKYCYTGDGCDSLFYGYPVTFKRANFLSKVGTLPDSLLSGATKVLERPSLERVVGRPYQVMLGALRSAQRDEETRTFLTFRVFDELSLKQLRLDGAPKANKSNEEIVQELSAPRRGTTPVRLAYEGKGKVSPNRNKINGSVDVSGLVIASPYMHHLVKSFAHAIPDDMLRPEGATVNIGKYLLSQMAEKKNLLPHDVIYQPKIGAADSPIENWYEDTLQDVVYTKLNSLPFPYSKRYVKSLMKTTRLESVYERYMSKGTNNIFTLSHCISLLTTYASFTEVANKIKK